MLEKGENTVAKECHISAARNRDPEGEPSTCQPKVGLAAKETHPDVDESLSIGTVCRDQRKFTDKGCTWEGRGWKGSADEDEE